jgi:hypothetical protein
MIVLNKRQQKLVTYKQTKIEKIFVFVTHREHFEVFSRAWHNDGHFTLREHPNRPPSGTWLKPVCNGQTQMTRAPPKDEFRLWVSHCGRVHALCVRSLLFD